MSVTAAAASGYVDELAAGWLAELRRDPVRAVEGLQLTMAAHQGGGSPQWLADLAMSMSENHDRATPEDPEAAEWCGYCGHSDPDDLVPGPDHRYLGEQADKFCADEDACAENRERRYPPDLARVPSWLLEAHHSASEEEAAGAMVRAVAGLAAREYLELVAAAGDEEIELSGQPVPLPGWQATQSGAWDTRGDFIPVNFNWAHWNWRHTIRGGAHMGHAISGGAPPPAAAGPGWPPCAPPGSSRARMALNLPVRARRARAASGEIPAEGLPAGVADALHGGHGGDIQMQQPQLPEAAPARSARQRPARDRYGRRRARWR